MKKFDCGCSWPIISEDPLRLDIDIYKIPLNCPKTWELLGTGKTKGIFQLEEYLGKKWSKEIKPIHIEHLGALGALLRPGCLKAKDEKGLSTTDHFSLRRWDKEKAEPIDHSVHHIMEDSFQLMIYQEHAIRIATVVAGFNPTQADTLRKCVTGDTMFVSKTRGWISIDRLLKDGYENDLFLIMDENGKQQWKKIEKIWSTGKHSITRIETDSGLCVDATKYHQFLTSDGWKARLRLSEEDNIVAANYVEWDGKDEISVDMAIVIAGLVTEGYFVANNSTFTNFDNKFMEVFIKSFNKEFGDVGSVSDNVFNIKKEQREIIHKYLEYGLARTKKLPDIMMGMTLETTRKFLSFILCAEGGVTESTGQFEFSSTSYQFIKQVKLLLLRFGIYSNVLSNYNDYGIYYRLYISNLEDQKKLLSELSIYLSDYKIKALTSNIHRSDLNFSANFVPKEIVKKLINQYPKLANYEGGSIYKNNITRKKFNRLCLDSGDVFWINFALGKHRYDKINKMDYKIKSIETFDFTVSGCDTPYIIANGMVIHNSIGKKKADLMAKVKKEFLEGCEKTGILSKEKAEYLFEQIEKSQRYSFNKSHAIQYGIIGYWTAYCKAHFPIAFNTSCLRNSIHDQDSAREVRNIVKDCKYSGISVITPDIRSKNLDFKIEDQNIRFGLTNIRGIGEKNIVKLLEKIGSIENKINKKLEEWNWVEILFLIGSVATKTVFEGLLKSGAFDFVVDRYQGLHEYNAISKINDDEFEFFNKLILNNPKYSNVLELLEESPNIQIKGKSKGETIYKKITEARLSKLRSIYKTIKNPPKMNNISLIPKDEAYMLGVPISVTKLDAATHNNVPDDVIENIQDLSYANVAVEISNVMTWLIKNGKLKGKEMSRMTIEDDTGILEGVVCFPEQWKNCGYVIFEGNTVMMNLEKSRDGKSFIVKDAWQI